MGKCSSLGNANPPIFENRRVFVARRDIQLHATKKEAISEAKQMQEVYAEFAEKLYGNASG
jgi:hypothetical protein